MTHETRQRPIDPAAGKAPSDQALAARIVEDGVHRYFKQRRKRIQPLVDRNISLRGSVSLDRAASAVTSRATDAGSVRMRCRGLVQETKKRQCRFCRFPIHRRNLSSVIGRSRTRLPVA
jgi:hypothetical protein